MEEAKRLADLRPPPNCVIQQLLGQFLHLEIQCLVGKAACRCDVCNQGGCIDTGF